jgi:hypothetical protein
MENKRIADPKIGSIVRHTGWQFEDNGKYPCDVLIVSGKYYGDYNRLSNHWAWHRIKRNGKLSKKVQGYGAFVESDTKYEICKKTNREGCVEWTVS